MNGLEVMWNDKPFAAAVDGGCLSVVLTNKDGKMSLSVGGIEADAGIL